MVDVGEVLNGKAIREIPDEGGGGAVITARFPLIRGAQITKEEFRARIEGAEGEVKLAIGAAVRRTYSSSGLKVKSGALLNAAVNDFEVSFFFRGSAAVVVEAEWPSSVKSQVPYFFAHLFGATITPRRAQALAIPQPGGGMIFVQSVTIPRRNFIKFDREARNDTKDILNRRLGEPSSGPEPTPPEQQPGGPREPRPTRTGRAPRAPRAPRVARVDALEQVSALARRAVAETLRGRRLTPFRLRKELRRAGISAAQARAIAEDLFALNFSAQQVEAVLLLGKENLLNLAGVVKMRLT